MPFSGAPFCRCLLLRAHETITNTQFEAIGLRKAKPLLALAGTAQCPGRASATAHEKKHAARPPIHIVALIYHSLHLRQHSTGVQNLLLLHISCCYCCRPRSLGTPLALGLLPRNCRGLGPPHAFA